MAGRLLEFKRLPAKQQGEFMHKHVVLLPLNKLIEVIDNGVSLQALHMSSLFFALKKLGKVQFS